MTDDPPATTLMCCYCEELPADITVEGETGDIPLCEGCLRQLFHKALGEPGPDHPVH